MRGGVCAFREVRRPFLNDFSQRITGPFSCLSLFNFQGPHFLKNRFAKPFLSFPFGLSGVPFLTALDYNIKSTSFCQPFFSIFFDFFKFLYYWLCKHNFSPEKYGDRLPFSVYPVYSILCNFIRISTITD